MPAASSITCISQGSVATVVAKSKVIFFMSLPDVSCQKLLKSANVSRSYSKNKSGTFFMNHGVFLLYYPITTK